MIEESTEIAATGLTWVCLAAWRSLPVFAVVLTLTLLLRKRIPARYSCVLWMLVVARLLMPFSIASPLAMSPDLNQVTGALFRNESAASEFEFDTFTIENDAGEDVTIRQPVLPCR